MTKDAAKAGELMQNLDQSQALATLDGAVAYLKAHEAVAADRIGVTGFCMGGTFALLMAAHNPDIKASAPFYGDVPGDDVLQKLQAPILFIGAADDPWITREKMGRLSEALKRFNKPGEVRIYPGVGHAFFNDTRPEAYDHAAAGDAWRRVLDFLAQHV